MTKELKLEVGKRYETVNVGVVKMIRVEADGTFMGRSVSGGVSRYWHSDGRVRDRYLANMFDLSHCLDDEPELVDLTKIDVPFGELDERTQDRLAGAWARGGDVEFKSCNSHGWHDIKRRSPGWFDLDVYRLKPTYTMPTVDDAVFRAMPGVKAIAWDDDVLFAHAFTEVPTPLYAEWARGDGYALSSLREALPLHHEFFGDLIQRGDCPWDQAIVLRPEGL